MITIAQCSNDAEAMLLKSLLEANGIEVLAPDQYDSLAGTHVAGAGVRLQVRDEDAETARRILAEAESATPLSDEESPA